MRSSISGLALLFIGLAAAPAWADDAPSRVSKPSPAFLALADVSLEVVPAQAKWGETVTVKLTISIKPGSDGHTYPFFPKDLTQTSKNTLALPGPDEAAAGGLIFLNDVVDPSAELKETQRPGDDVLPGIMDQYYDTPVTWNFKAVVSPKASGGKKEVSLGKTRIQVCNNENCVPAFGDQFRASFTIVEAASDRVVPADLMQALKILATCSAAKSPTLTQPIRTTTDPPVAPAASAQPAQQRIEPTPRSVSTVPAPSSEPGVKTAKDLEAYRRELASIRGEIQKEDTKSGVNGGPPETGLWGFVLTAAVWGLISLVTPCVFPMIPITVSIFLKHAHGSLRERLKLAGVYCLTIISVLGVSAFALLKFMAWLSANPITNILLGTLFIILALSLFGMYEIMLPNFMARRLQAKQAKGGVVGTIFGALAFTVISFTCVAPFLGGFAGISSADAAGGSLISVPTTREIAGGLAFATAFAAPFFILAMIPGLLKALPRSGGWLDSVKVVMGFLELAAALKFLRTAEVRLLSPSEYFTYDLVLGGWVAISFGCGLYLLNAYRLPHDEEKPNIGVMRLLFALLFLGLGFYLLPATFKGPDGKSQRPSGAVYAWVEAFLLPEGDKGWSHDLQATLERAKKSGRPIFVDFTGKTCTNCKYNEHNVFTQPSVDNELGQFERVQLYTDEVPSEAFSTDPGKEARTEEAYANGDFQRDVFGSISLPLYAVLQPLPDGKFKILGTREGKINNPSTFAQWLKESVDTAKRK
jgi:thiol:disulfide interchange protein DsbD